MIRLIAALDRSRGIGKNGGQPWKIPADEVYFATCTKSQGGKILVGSTTYKTFKHPLRERTNYVLTSHNEPLEGAILVHNLKQFLTDMGDQDVWVTGGAAVFEQVIATGLPMELYLTHIDAEFGCDRFFPAYEDEFTVVDQTESQEQNGFNYYYAIYRRRRNLAT